MRVIQLVFGAVFVLTLSSCGKSQEAQSTIAIQRAAPSGEQALVVGEMVGFSIEVRAQNFRGPAHVGLVIQSADRTVLASLEPVPIDPGKSVQLEASVTVPKTTSIQVFTPLFLGDKSQTSVLDTRIYKVL